MRGRTARANGGYLQDQLSAWGKRATLYLLGNDIPERAESRVPEEDEARTLLQILLHLTDLHNIATLISETRFLRYASAEVAVIARPKHHAHQIHYLQWQMLCCS